MDSYRSWEDFLDPEPQPKSADREQAATTSDAPKSIAELFDNPDVPEGVKQLLRRHQQLERDLKRCAGIPVADDEEDPDARRKELAYPVFVHSKQTRIEQRKRRRLRELRQLFEKRRLEALRLERKRLLEAEEARLRAQEERERRLREARLAARRRREQARLEREREAMEARLQQRLIRAKQQAQQDQAVERLQEKRLHAQRLEDVREQLRQQRIVQRKEEALLEERRSMALRKLEAKREEFARFS